MPPCHPFRPVPGQCGPHRRGPLPAPPFDPRDYWATKKFVSSLFGSLETRIDNLDEFYKVDVVDPGAATEAGQAADAKSTYEELNRVLGVANDARGLAESKADRATTLSGYGITDAATKAELVAKADLVDGKVPAAQLPSYVDDVLEYGSKSEFPASGESGKIYVDKETNKTYRWSGTQYVEISPSLALGETASTAYPGDRGKAAADKAEAAYNVANGMASAVFSHVENKSNPHAVTAAQVGAVPLVEDYKGNKTAVTIGGRDGEQPVGEYSLANGIFTTASGNYSHAEGVNTTASGFYSHAEGGNTTAYGESSHAEGAKTTASGDYSHAAGYMAQTRSGDAYSFAWNGDDKRSDPYLSHGPGTFNINPKDGLDGFYIGEQKLAMILSNKSDEITRFIWTSDDPSIPDGWIDLANSPSAPQPYFAAGYWSCDKIGGCEVVTPAQGTEDDLTFTLGFGDPTVAETFSATATRKRVLRTGDAATPKDLTDAISTNNPAFVSAVQNTPTSGMPEDMPTDWGTFGAVGAALAALATGLKWCKNILGSLASGYSTFAAWIASKLDRASLLTEYSATSAYSVGAIVYHDGNIYQCKTAIAEGGETWNAEHWELRKLDDFFTESNSLLTGTIDAEVISKGTAPDAHLEAPTDERLKLILADNSVAYDSAKALPYKLTSAIGDRVIATMTLTAASTDITLPTIAANDTTVKDFILDVTNAYAVEGVATDAGINIPRTDFKLVTRDGESLTAVTTVKAGKSAFICFTQKSPVVVDGTTYPCWCVIQLPFGDPS